MTEKLQFGPVRGPLTSPTPKLFSPAPSPAPSPVPAPQPVIRLVFTGDIMVHQPQLDQALQPDTGAYDFTPQLRHVTPLLRGDAVIGNFETVLAGAEAKYTDFPRFNTPDALADALDAAGFTTLLLANNHMLDRGVDGAAATWAKLRDRGFTVTGAFPHQIMTARGLPADRHSLPLLLDVQGVLVGILNYSYGCNLPLPPDDALTLNIIRPERIGADIDVLRASGAEVIVATFHWGNEYSPSPSVHQRRTAAFCLERGVDIIVGTHPHILQPLEILHTPALPSHLELRPPHKVVPEKPKSAPAPADVPEVPQKTRVLAWSLGNFISSQRTLPRERSAVLAVDLQRPAPGEPPHILRVAVAPIWMERDRPGYMAIPAMPAPDDGFPAPAAHRLAIHTDVLRKLGAAEEGDEAGFHTVYQRPAEGLPVTPAPAQSTAPPPRPQKPLP